MTPETPTYSTGPRGGARITCPCGFSSPANPAAATWKCKACKRSWPTHPDEPEKAPPPSECESCRHIRLEHPGANECKHWGCLCPKWQPKGPRRNVWRSERAA